MQSLFFVGHEKNFLSLHFCRLFHYSSRAFSLCWIMVSCGNAKFIYTANCQFGCRQAENESPEWWWHITFSLTQCRTRTPVWWSAILLSNKQQQNKIRINSRSVPLASVFVQRKIPFGNKNRPSFKRHRCHRLAVASRQSTKWSVERSLLRSPATSSILTAWTLISSTKIVSNGNDDENRIGWNSRIGAFAAFNLFERPSRFTLYSMWWIYG